MEHAVRWFDSHFAVRVSIRGAFDLAHTVTGLGEVPCFERGGGFTTTTAD
jgi:hypothetical protein